MLTGFCAMASMIGAAESAHVSCFGPNRSYTDTGFAMMAQPREILVNLKLRPLVREFNISSLGARPVP